MQLSRLRGRKVNDYIRRNGRLWKGKSMVIRWMPGAPRHPSVDRKASAIYLGTAASAKLHKSAVKRNRMRRRCREAFRIAIREMKDVPPLQLLVNPRIASLHADFPVIQEDVRRFFSISLG